MKMRIKFVSKGVPVIAAPWISEVVRSNKKSLVIDEDVLTLKVQSLDDYLCFNEVCFSKEDVLDFIPKMGNKLFAVSEKGLLPLEIRSSHYYKLRALDKPGHPTLEIDGIHMHRISGTDPWRDTLSKVKPLRIKKGDKVLDTCMGLGYTAIAALSMGATVVTVEKSKEVIELASWNPWSSRLQEAIVLNDDVANIIKRFGDESFDKIIHDPPAMPLAGELYSKEFYAELFRVLKRGGRLFHYTGASSRSRPFDIVRSVSKRLMEVGFEVRKVPKALGVLAIKPR